MIRRMLAISTLAAAGAASGADFCVSSGTQLSSALQTAGSNGQDDIVRVIGPVEAPVGGFVYDIDGSRSLTVIGNAGAAFGSCKFTVSATFGFTWSLPTQYGSASPVASPLFRIVGSLGDNGDITLKNITLDASNGPRGLSQGGALNVSLNDGYGGRIHLERLDVRNGLAVRGGGVSISSVGSVSEFAEISVVRSVFAGNVGEFAGALAVDVEGGSTTIQNNAFAYNATAAGSAVEISGSGRYNVLTNAFWLNSERDVHLDTDTAVVHENMMHAPTGLPALPGGINISPIDPLFKRRWDFTPELGSPLIRSGAVDLGAFEVN